MLIGRSRIDVDNFQSKISAENYIKIKEFANEFIIKQKICILPVDVVSVVNNCKWILIPYSKATQEIKDFYDEIMYTDWGFTIEYHGQCFIFYDDSIKLSSQRFTIAHEIGHIVLNHFISSNATTREKEANLFATKLLMPLNILYNCNVKSKKELETLCGVSYTAASNRFEKLEKLRFNKRQKIKTKEKQIEKQFHEFVENYKKRQKSV